jgi:hypothetical protein
VLRGASESEIRRMHLAAPRISYDLAAQRGEVPSAGRLLLQDTMPESPQREGGSMFGKSRGATAFQWEKDLVMDLAGEKITMSGDVLIVHQEPDSKEPTGRMQAARVQIDLFSAPAAPGTGSDAKSDPSMLGPSELRIKDLLADGGVRLSLPQLQLDAAEVAYDAVDELLTARGSDREPVEVFSGPGVSRGSFQEVVWNARTDQIEMRQVRAQVRR